MTNAASRRVAAGGQRRGDVGERLLAHVPGPRAAVPRVERVDDVVGAQQVGVGRLLVGDELGVLAGDLVHREVGVEGVRVGVGAVVVAAHDVRGAGPDGAPPVLHDVRGGIDRPPPDGGQVGVERGHLGGHRRLGVLLGQELAVRPAPVVPPTAAPLRAPLGLAVHHPVVEEALHVAGRPLLVRHHERRVPLERRLDRLDDVELQRRRQAGAVADDDVVLAQLAEAQLIDLVVGGHRAERGDRRLRRVLRGQRIDRLRGVQVDLGRHVGRHDHAGDDADVDHPFAIEAVLHVGVAGDVEELEAVGLADARGQREAGVGQVAAVGALDDVRVDVEDVEPVGPGGGAAAGGPGAPGVLALHPVVHVLEPGAGRLIGRHQDEGADAARALDGDVGVVVAGERVVDGPRLVDDVVGLVPVLVEGERQPDVAHLHRLGAGVGDGDLPGEVVVHQRVGLGELEVLDPLGVGRALIGDDDRVGAGGDLPDVGRLVGERGGPGPAVEPISEHQLADPFVVGGVLPDGVGRVQHVVGREGVAGELQRRDLAVGPDLRLEVAVGERLRAGAGRERQQRCRGDRGGGESLRRTLGRMIGHARMK